MAITTYADFKSRLEAANNLTFYKAGTSASARLASQWLSVNLAGATPSTAVACSNTTTGALNLERDLGVASHDFRIVGANMVGTSSVSPLFVDRLSHMGGLSGTTTGAQTTNLPTAALTRYTSGEGVMAAIEIYLSVGATATVARCSYTNQAGTVGKTSKDVVFGGTGNAIAGRVIVFPLADGDTGVRSIESVTVDASTLTAGNFGVVLFKPLALLPPYLLGADAYGVNFYNALIRGGCQFEEVLAGACLGYVYTAVAATNTVGNISYMDVT